MTFRPIPTLVLSVSLLSLTACASNWLPSGYAHQNNNTPISTPAHTNPWSDKTVIHDTEKMANSTAAWQGAVFDLLEKLSPAIPKDGTPLIVTTTAPYNAQDLSFDHYLRQGLMQKGYNLTTTAGTALYIGFEIAPLSSSSAMEIAKKEAGYIPVKGANLEGLYLLQLTIKKTDNKTILGKAAITAVLPYEKSGHEIFGYRF